jgi:hypothetical protein
MIHARYRWKISRGRKTEEPSVGSDATDVRSLARDVVQRARTAELNARGFSICVLEPVPSG